MQFTVCKEVLNTHEYCKYKCGQSIVYCVTVPFVDCPLHCILYDTHKVHTNQHTLVTHQLITGVMCTLQVEQLQLWSFYIILILSLWKSLIRLKETLQLLALRSTLGGKVTWFVNTGPLFHWPVGSLTINHFLSFFCPEAINCLNRAIEIYTDMVRKGHQILTIVDTESHWVVL